MPASLFARARSLWRGMRRGGHLDAEMRDEMETHLALRVADLVRAGLSPDAAARQARLEFGSPEHYAGRGRDARGLRCVDGARFSWLDVKLGARMLVKYPGLTIVGGVAIAFAIAVGTASFEFIKQLVDPTLPLPEGNRIVAVQLWDAGSNANEPHAAYDFVGWRSTLTTIQELGAYRTYSRNLIIDGGSGEPVDIAEITAAGFALPHVPPLLGRPILPSDERPGAPQVVVLGYDVWQTRFHGDRTIVGRTTKLGGATATIVGVMPDGFGFPVAQNAWTASQLDLASYAPRAGPALTRVVGRLAPGASMADAQAELDAVEARLAARAPETHARLRARVRPYAGMRADSGREALAMLSINVFLVMLLVLIGGNVALLMFARAATRENEILVRNALGASRARIVMQLFAEALVLVGVGAALGLAVSSAAVPWALHLSGTQRLPFWIRPGLAPSTVVYALSLTVLAAAIAGLVPGLKVTAGGLDARLRHASAGGGGLKFGGVWTVVIVAQVAVTVAFPVAAFFAHRDAVQIESMDPGFRTSEFLTARLEMDSATSASGELTPASRARFRAEYAALEQRLLAEPGVISVSFADRLPRMYHPHRLIDVDSGGSAPLNPSWPAYRVSSALVGPNYFVDIGVPMLAGRAFSSADHDTRNHVAIVNQSFVHLVLGDRNPIGRRLRYVHFEEQEDEGDGPSLDKPGPWYEIVGVVRDMAMAAPSDPKVAGIYHPVPVGGAYPAQLAIHVRGDPSAFVSRARDAVLQTDPSLRLSDIEPLDLVNRGDIANARFWFEVLALVSGLAMLLSMAGIYAVMSFAVSRRTREIGVRVALGASRRRIVTAVFAAPLRQVAMGVAAGASLATLLTLGIYESRLTMVQLSYVIAYSTIMMAVCLLACVVPTRRALAVQPTEALRAD
jgi:predicted permease